jgi:hypothetical protein
VYRNLTARPLIFGHHYVAMATQLLLGKSASAGRFATEKFEQQALGTLILESGRKQGQGTDGD